MFYKNEAINSYFMWLIRYIHPEYPTETHYKLLQRLFDTTFVYEYEMDANRAQDGLGLRDQFEYENNLRLDMTSQCSVLEMMIALAIRCEQDIMNIPSKGDRTYIWFWMMVDNLNLMRMNDYTYDKYIVDAAMFNFMYHMYDPDGMGGLFCVPGNYEIRDMEIWDQLNEFLNQIITEEGDYQLCLN